MVKLTKNSKIYILCPANIATGGPESLHLLCDMLLSKNHDAYLVYLHNAYPGGGGHPGHGWQDRQDGWLNYISKEGTPPDYKEYNIQTTSKIEDDPSNLLVSPEIFLNSLEKFTNIQKSIWWLASRINEDGTYDEEKWYKSLPGVSHFHNSYFAEFMLRSIPHFEDNSIYQLQTYVNTEFQLEENNKENIVCYNPKKGFEYTSEIIKYFSDNNDIKFIPIQNMNRGQVKETLKKAKVYIDLGNHPGRERLPREAVMSGCCVLTSFRGSAQFYRDVPITNEYKFSTNPLELNRMCDTIKDCIENYETHNINFHHYRRVISNNPTQFKIDVDNIFGNV